MCLRHWTKFHSCGTVSILMETNTIRVDMMAGARDVAPIAFAAVVIGMSFGILARDAGMGVVAPIVMSLTTFAGSAQMAAAGVLNEGGAVAAAVAAAVLLNLRYVAISV